MLTLASTQAVARELPQPANLKYVLWAASLSPQKRLGWNIAQARTLLPYLAAPLPQDVEAVWHILRAGHPFVSRNNARAILRIEAADREGRLRDLERMPTSYHDWLTWRQAVVGLRSGLSYKAASFVALLLWPDQCPLIPVDSHVCARLGLRSMYKPACDSYKAYRWIERQVLREWYPHRKECSPAEWHWYKWSQWRQATGDEQVSDRPESHLGLTVPA